MMSAFLPEAWGQIYQYPDKNGNAVFTDNPPAGAKTKQLKEDGVYRSNRSESDYPAYKERTVKKLHRHRSRNINVPPTMAV